MFASPPRRVTRIGLLTFLLQLVACGSTEPAADFEPRLSLVESRGTGSLRYTSSDCRDPLFSPRAAATVTPLNVDFCKELVIIDHEVISGMSELSFKKVMARMLGTSPEDTRLIMKRWADSWATTDVDDPARADLAAQVFAAWHDDRIRLIAVVNRLDLALGLPFLEPGPDLPPNLGEGRLIYQLYDARGAQEMTLILEFAYAPLDPRRDKERNLTLWADKWQRLRAQSGDAREFRDNLRLLVAEFAVPLQLRRIRTNEALKWINTDGEVVGNVEWAFRQYDFTGCAPSLAFANCRPQLTWVPLPDTPLDEYRGSRDIQLLNYLARDGVLEDLRKGVHEFGKRDHPANRIEMDMSARVHESGTTWGAPRLMDEARLLMSFNTCNGCHSDFKKDSNVLPHITVPSGQKQPRLSSFLNQRIPLKYELAGCRDVALWHGCGKGTPYFYWDEQLHRAYYYFSHLSTTKALKMPALQEPKLYYRYH